MRNGRDGRKSMSFWALFRRIAGYLFEYYRFRMSFVLFLLVLGAASEVAAAALLRTLIDDCLTGVSRGVCADAPSLPEIFGTMTFFYCAGIVSTYISRRMMAEITRGTTKNVRVELFAHMEKLPMDCFDARGRGEIMSIFTNDTDTLRQLISQSIPQMVSSGVTILGAVLGMFFLEPVLAAITTGVTGMMSILVHRLTRKNAAFYFAQQEELAELNRYAEEMLEGQKTIRLFSQEEKSAQEFDRKNEQWRESAFRSSVCGNTLLCAMTDGSYVFYTVAAAAGLWQLGRKEPGLALGTLAAFLQLSRMLIQPISRISGQISYIITALAGAGRMFAFLEEEEERNDGTIRLIKDESGRWFWTEDVTGGRKRPFKGAIDFLQVGFAYGGRTDVLHNLYFSVRSGSMSAIVGPTEAGKTTILQLLNRFYDPDSGIIQIDGLDIRRVKKGDMRKAVGVVTQDSGTEGWEHTGRGNP